MSKPSITFTGKHDFEDFKAYGNALEGSVKVYARINWEYWFPRLEVVLEKEPPPPKEGEGQGGEV